MIDEEAVASLMLNQRIALVSLTAGLGEQEADRLWTRCSIMLTLNAGLLTIASFTLSCQSALKSIQVTASNNVQLLCRVIPFLAPFSAV